MNKFRIELLVLLLLTILSCKSDIEILEDESIGVLENDTKNCLLEEIHHNEGVIKLFYDESDRLVSTEKHKAFAYQEKESIFYNNENQVEKIKVFGQDSQIKENRIFIYTNNLLTEIEYFDIQEFKFRSITFEYDEMDRLTSYQDVDHLEDQRVRYNLAFNVEYFIDKIRIQYNNTYLIVIEEYTRNEGSENWTNLEILRGEWDCGIDICYSKKHLVVYDDKPFKDDKTYHFPHLPIPNIFNNKNNVLGLDSGDGYLEYCNVLGHYPDKEGNISSLRNAFEYNEDGYLSFYFSGITNTEQKYIYDCE